MFKIYFKYFQGYKNRSKMEIVMLSTHKNKINVGNIFAVDIYNFNSVQDGIQMDFIVHNYSRDQKEKKFFLLLYIYIIMYENKLGQT